MSDLDRIVSDATSWHWWLMVVAVGVAINLLSNFLRTPLDYLLAKLSSARQRIRNERKIELALTAGAVAESVTLLSLEVREEFRSYLLAVFSMLISTLLFSYLGMLKSTFPSDQDATFVKLAIPLILFVFFFWAIAMVLLTKGLDHGNCVTEARRLLEQRAKEGPKDSAA